MSIKLLNKILLIVLVLLIINTLIPLKVNAISDMFSAADDFLSKGESPKTVIDEEKLISTSSTIYKWLMIIAICVVVIIGAILGVLFITGSIEGKAKIQEAFAPYIIGCLIVFGSFFIWKTLVNVGNDLEGDTIDAVSSPVKTTPGICSICSTQLTDNYLGDLGTQESLTKNCPKCGKDVTVKPYGM